jgi:hypothetical protein
MVDDKTQTEIVENKFNVVKFRKVGSVTAKFGNGSWNSGVEIYGGQRA